MNIEKLFTLMPKEFINEKDINDRIDEQRGIIKAGNSFVSNLSINRYLYKKLAEFEIDERLNLFSNLANADFNIDENELYFNKIDIESFNYLLEEKFNLEDMYELDNLYIENLLYGKDISKEIVNIHEENMSFEQVIGRFVFHTSGMSPGDTPTIILMLVVKKALLGSFLAEKNVESLLNGQTEIYNISILM